MPVARRARSPEEDASMYGGDTDQESVHDTPKPARALKKRVSEIHYQENDGSFTEGGGGASGRPPLRTVNINDDAAEKRRRRKSTKLAVVENALAGPSSEGAMQESQPDNNGADGPRVTGAKQKPLKSVVPPVVSVPTDVMNSNFEEWMKLATDNKINAQNSWNFALIDYFHDMSLLRNTDDNSINFQRASYTLDGCVKIWTSRVDSVGTETGKLLSNLESGGKDIREDEGEDSDNPDGDPTQGTKKKAKKHIAGNTLAKDPASLKNKKPDLEFAVDPLFKKTCADFDEGGASGLLMNHLSLGIGTEGCMRVIFDASDPMGQVEEEDPIQEPEDDLDLSYLRSNFFPDLSVLENKAISHSLSDFAFGKETFNFDGTQDSMYQDNTQHIGRDGNADYGDDDNDDFGLNLDAPNGDAPEVEDFFAGNDAAGDDFGGDFGGDDFGGDNVSQDGSAEQAGGEPQGRPGPYVPFDPRKMPNERDLVLAMADDAEGALDYFDKAFLNKNWAGPEHWKLRKNFRKRKLSSARTNSMSNDIYHLAEGDGASKPNKRQKKDPIKIDFTTPLDKRLSEVKEELFAPVTKGAGINMAGTGGKNSKKNGKLKEDHRLPDDMHFSSKQLVTLFLKPKFFLRMRGRRVKMNEGDGEVDENFWAQAAADHAANRNRDGDDDDSNEPAPFNTQFFNDDDFGPGFDDAYDAEIGVDNPNGTSAEIDEGEQDLLAATQGQTRRVKPEFVNYTRRAKRVDVRKLKENIWKGLDIVIEKKVEKEKEDDSMDIDVPEDPDKPKPTDPSESRQFSQVISGLQRSYPKEKMEEISTSFCFICLLHLANEQGLKLESAAPLGTETGLVEEEEEVEEEVKDGQKKVGNLWDIKIYRDPDATQSA
ncbi:barren [Agrocybe pediades]|nr:barren [Agrocybe pediades]